MQGLAPGMAVQRWAAAPAAAARPAAKQRHPTLQQQQQPWLLAAPVQRRRRERQRGLLPCRTMAAAQVDVETARKLLDGPATVLDIRPEQQYEESRITKPPRKSVNVPFAAGPDGRGAWVAAAGQKLPNKASKVLVMCGDGGAASAEAAALLEAAGYTGAAQVEGGYTAYSQVWGPSGKRRPPAGRWISTGKEALKSGLNIPGVAESYDEGGNLKQARWAKGLEPGQALPPST